MARIRIYTQADYSALYGRFEEKVKLDGSENIEQLRLKGLQQFAPSGANKWDERKKSGRTVWETMYGYFENSSKRKSYLSDRKEYLDALAEAQLLPGEFVQQFEDLVRGGMRPNDALRQVQENYKKYLQQQIIPEPEPDWTLETDIEGDYPEVFYHARGRAELLAFEDTFE